MLVPHCVDQCSFAVSFEIGESEFSNFVLLFQGHLSYSRSLAFSYEFKDNLVNFYKEVSWNFDVDCIKSVDQFAILTILSLLIHLDLVFLSTMFCRFQCIQFTLLLLNLFLSIFRWYFIWIFPLISFSDCSWQVHKNTIDFCILILYLATLLKDK